jgi:hypothetical protein
MPLSIALEVLIELCSETMAEDHILHCAKEGEGVLLCSAVYSIVHNPIGHHLLIPFLHSKLSSLVRIAFPTQAQAVGPLGGLGIEAGYVTDPHWLGRGGQGCGWRGP